MKRHFTFLLILSMCMSLLAQNEGLSYQAVIINPDVKQLPGVNAKGNILPDTDIAIRFTIINALNEDEFQEVQYTRTDRFGMVNLLIGSENIDDFSLINWDGSIKDLKVEFDFDGSGGNFVDISRQQLTFIPYAYHRNITATGTLSVDETTDLNGVLQVHGMTYLNSSLNVGGQTTLNNTLTTNKNIYVNDSLFVDSVATFRGSAIFQEPVELDKLTVSGQTIIKPPLVNANKDSIYSSYPLLIEGSSQGIAIQVSGSRDVSNNYISFWDKGETDDRKMWGRIEGQTADDIRENPEYIAETSFKAIDFGINAFEIVSIGLDVTIAAAAAAATLSDVRACVGLGACVTTPSIGLSAVSALEWVKVGTDLIFWIANSALAASEELAYQHFIFSQKGVSYESGSGDYAEWLLKENPNDQFFAGELVGVKNGKVSKQLFSADRVMVISTNPIVLGNMPQEKDESKYEKIAFMGQVPVRVTGEVLPGDYILPHEIMLGFGKAVNPENMAPRDYKKVVGVAWNTLSSSGNNISVINVAVGINTNDLADAVAAQNEELTALWAEYDILKQQIEQSNMALANLVPGYSDYVDVAASSNFDQFNTTAKLKSSGLEEEPCPTCPDSIKYVTISFTREQLEFSFDIAKADYQKMFEDTEALQQLTPTLPRSGEAGYKSSTQQPAFPTLVSMEEHPFWSRINSDPAYKEEIAQYIKTNLEEATKKLNLDNDSVKYNFEFKGF